VLQLNIVAAMFQGVRPSPAVGGTKSLCRVSIEAALSTLRESTTPTLACMNGWIIILCTPGMLPKFVGF
jgi:hypothetical protein